MTEGDAMSRIAPRVQTTAAALGLALLTSLGCVQRPPLVVETSTGEVVRLESWAATLSSPDALGGTATLTPLTYRETLATITVSRAAPRSVHAWYVQLGQCGRDLGILVGPQAYAPLVADDQGYARSTVTLPFTVPTSGNYFVSVREADSERTPTTACGNLTKDSPLGGPAIAEARAP
jgi:hypothetical protein